MPEIDGFETAELIRARKGSSHTPVLFLTGYRSDEQLFFGYDLGAVDFLFKPIVPEILQSKVAVFVELSRKEQLLRRKTETLERTERKFPRGSRSRSGCQGYYRRRRNHPVSKTREQIRCLAISGKSYSEIGSLIAGWEGQLYTCLHLLVDSFYASAQILDYSLVPFGCIPSRNRRAISVGPFVGTYSESFEEFPAGTIAANFNFGAPPPPVPIMSGFANFTLPSPNGQLYIYDPLVPSEHFGINDYVAQVIDGTQGLAIQEQADAILSFGGNGVSEFGGYFTTDAGTELRFFDSLGDILGVDDLPPTSSNDGTLTWLGWESVIPISSIEISTPGFAMDALQATPAPEPATWTVIAASLCLLLLGAERLRLRRLASAKGHIPRQTARPNGW